MNVNFDPDDGFDPEQIRDIEEMMDEIIAEDGTGYELVLWISHREAKQLVKQYENYLSGDSIGPIERFIEQLMSIAAYLKDVLSEEDN